MIMQSPKLVVSRKDINQSFGNIFKYLLKVFLNTVIKVSIF